MFAPRLLLLLFGLLTVSVQCSDSGVRPTKHHRDDDNDDHEHDKFISFKTFLDQVERAKFKQYKHTQVRDEAAFNEMKCHILDTYEGVGEVTSFILANEYADCIAILRQPAMRKLGITEIPDPPTHSQAGETCTECRSPGNFTYADSPLRLGLKDEFRNPISCPKHAFPMNRLTLEKLTLFATLREFFSKPAPAAGDPVHLHAQTQQAVTNYGGNSWLNLWKPTGVFSISQQWYFGGPFNAVGTPMQTVEGGWQVFPKMYGDGQSRLFVYYTADYYLKTGCYNHGCAAFMQMNNNWYLGGPWNHYSTSGGVQWGFEMQWKLYGTNWWLFLKGPGDYEAVGFYSGAIYNKGPLANSSSTIAYGGEVANLTAGQNWPQMGSGTLAEKGFGEAAFQKSIFFIPRNENDGVGVWADPFPSDEAKAACYTIDQVGSANGGNWGTYFYFGGPGGRGCPL